MISAKVVADSITATGDRLTTLEITLPRYILAEGKTHRIISGMLEQVTVETSVGLNDEYYLSKNSASSRAIPFNKMIKEVQENPFIPYAFQKDHSGMQGTEYFTEAEDIEFLIDMWQAGIDSAIERSKALNNPEAFVDKRGLTKQMTNRLLEPFMYHKVLISATEWDNFFNLRCPSYALLDDEGNHIEEYAKSRKEWCGIMNAKGTTIHYVTDYSIIDWLKINKGQADIHMMFLAEAIYDARNESTPKKLKEGEWHIPYGDNMDVSALLRLGIKENLLKTKESIDDYDALDYDIIDDLRAKISIARCARLSYQTLGDNPEINYEKDLELYDTLSKSGHWSPFEHVAKVMTGDEYNLWVKGKLVENFDRDNVNYPNDDSTGWCRNFRGFIQYRELLDN